MIIHTIKNFHECFKANEIISNFFGYNSFQHLDTDNNMLTAFQQVSCLYLSFLLGEPLHLLLFNVKKGVPMIHLIRPMSLLAGGEAV